MLQRPGVCCQVTCQLWVCMHHQFHYYHLNYQCPGCVPTLFMRRVLGRDRAARPVVCLQRLTVVTSARLAVKKRWKLRWWTVNTSHTLVSDVPFTSVNPLPHSVPCLSLCVSVLSMHKLPQIIPALTQSFHFRPSLRSARQLIHHPISNPMNFLISQGNLPPRADPPRMQALSPPRSVSD